MSLRHPRLGTQLIALLIGLLSVAFAAVAVVTALELHHFLVQRLDQDLRAAGGRYAATLEHHGKSDDDADDQQFDVPGQATGTLGARVKRGVVTAAHVVGRSAADQPRAAARAVLSHLAVSTDPRTVRLPDIGEYRVLAKLGDDGDVLITGLPLHKVDDTTERLIAIEAVVFGVTLAVIALGGAALVRLSLRPLTRVADTASRVAGLPLSSGEVQLVERAPGGPPGTEVGALSAAFNNMLEQVESALQRRQESEDGLRRFLAEASHELRTPLAVVRGHAELATRLGSSLPPEIAHSLQRIDAESARMGHLVDDLLLLARLGSGRPLAREEVDLTRIVLDAVSDASAAAPDHRWELDLPEEPVVVVGDDHALHQVIANLLANARTHTPAGTVVLARLRPLDDSVQLDVVDDGPGIPAEALPRIFERFARADTTRSATTGSSGLGLAIVRAIAEAHGGTVSVESRPGSTMFRVSLAMDPPAGQSPPPP